MRVVVVGVHRAAEDEHRVVRLERPRRRRAPGEAPLVEPVAALLDRRREELRARVVAVDDRENVHRAELYAPLPPVAGMPLTSSSRRSCCAFVAACEIRPSGFSGSADDALLLKNAYASFATARELLQRAGPFAELLVGVEVVEPLGRRAAALVPRAEVPAVEADVGGARRHGGHGRDEVLRGVRLRRVDRHVRRADALEERRASPRGCPRRATSGGGTRRASRRSRAARAPTRDSRARRP